MNKEDWGAVSIGVVAVLGYLFMWVLSLAVPVVIVLLLIRWLLL